MIYETHLLNLVKHFLILNFKEQGVESMCINNYLPLCAALLYPYKDAYIQKNERTKDTILPIIKAVKFFSNTRKNLSCYTIKGLCNCFQHEWLPSLDSSEQVKLINGLSLITNIEDNGFISIKGNEKVYDFYLNQAVFPDISQKYGNDDYIISEADNQNEEEIHTVENNRKGTVSLSALKNWLLANFPINDYPKGIKEFQFFWQYKLSQEQYSNLKSILLDLNLKNNKSLLKKRPFCEEYGTVATSVALFLSEWYKRECKSLSGNHCLEVLKLNSSDSTSIWTPAGLSQSYLHIEGDNDQERRQTAMCALGGLPLYYIVEERPERFNKFVNGLFILKNKKEEITDEDIESIVDCFDDNNRLFKRSLKSGSCKEYLIKLVDYLENGNIEDLPFAESDMENSPFAGFIKRLQEGYDDALPKNFFQKEIRIWTYDFMEEDDESNLIESEFYVHIGFLKSNNVITTRDLSKLGIMLPPEANMFDARLKITLRDGSSTTTDEKRTYHKIGNHCDDFCGAFGSSLATSIDFYNTKDIALLIESGDYCEEIPLYTIPSYLELYATDNGFLWTDKKNNAAQKVVFYDKNIYTLQNEDIEPLTKSDGENYWGWIYQAETITLIDSNGEQETIGLGESELIMVDFKVNSLRKTIEFSKDGCVECVIQDDDIKEIPLLYIDDRKRPMFACDGMRGNDLLINYKIEFKTTSDHYYSEWTTNNVPSQGFLSIRISCRDDRKKKKPRKLDVYFIPGTYPIVKRNLDNNYIYIKGENVCVLDKLLKNNLSTVNGEFNYRYKDSHDNLKSSSIPFQIGDEENHIILKVYRAFNWTQILNNGKTIKNITNDGSEKPPVALILQGNKLVKVVNEEGYKIYSPCYQRYLDYFGDPRNLSFVKQGKSLSGFYIDESSQPFLYCVYISSFDDNGKIRKIEKKRDDNGNESFLLNVSNKEENKKEYSFYYWSGELKDAPVKLDPKDSEEKPFCFDIPFPLHRKAVVFQSLRDYSPNLYFRPFYESVMWNNYVQRYDNATIDYLINCYRIAVEHNVYFCIFPALRNLQKRHVFTDFIRAYILGVNYHLTKDDNKNLIRLAKELAMDWFFVSRRELFARLDDDSKKKMLKCMKELLLCSPIERREHAYSKIFIDRFLKSNRPFNVRDGKLPRKFLKALDQFNDYDGRENTQNRIDLLNRLVSTDVNIFQEICNILNI